MSGNAYYDWERYWCPRDGTFNLSDGGYLVSPEGRYGPFYAGDVRRYEDISKIPCLVLLGEPGIGKTTALEAIASEEEKSHQYVRLDLGEFSSEDRLFRQFFENKDLQNWRDGTGILLVLIDGLDECRIAGIAKVLGRELTRMPTERLRLRIACRTEKWPITLEESLREAWGQEYVGVHELMPLTKKDVAKAASDSGIEPDEFLEEIARVRAQPLAIKPVTLKFLLNQFRAKKILPTEEATLYLQGCRFLCEESQERQDAGAQHVCDAAHRFELAQRIAYVTIFSGRFAVWTGAPDGSIPAEDVAIDDLLGTETCDGNRFNVNEAAIRDTLNTGLFSSSGAYRMGWAHQTFAEFLASRYVISRLDAKQRGSLLLLANKVGAHVVPQLSEVAARVASSDKLLFQKILVASPNVLLGSYVATADYPQRASLLASLLTQCDAGEIHFRDVGDLNRLQHLGHPGITDQLRPYLVENRFSLQARALALAAVDSCGVDGLKTELLALALDRSADMELRCRALTILGRDVGADIAQRIRPLAEGSSDDPNSRLKGHALRALWPKFLMAEELFQLLTPKRRERVLGVYDLFLREVTNSLRPQDLPAALTWAQAQGSRGSLGFHFRKFLDGVLFSAWNQLNETDILSLLADTLRKRLAIDHGHILDGSDYEDSGFLSDEAKRRALLAKMVTKVQNIDGETYYLSRLCGNLSQESDFVWMVGNAVSASTEREAEIWASLCRFNYNINLVAETDALLAAYNASAAIRDQFASFVEPIEIDSLHAQKLKKNYQRSGFPKGTQQENLLLDPPPAIRVKNLLNRCQEGEPCLWWCVAQELTLEPRSTHYEESWEPDLTILPGWKEADDRTRSRIREAAKLYILECDDRRADWLHQDSTILYAANAGYQALRLIHETEPMFVREIPAEAWGRWAAGLLYHPLNISDEESERFHSQFIEQMFKAAPVQGTGAVGEIIQRESGVGAGFLGVLSRVEHIKCAELSGMLKCLILEKRLSPKGAAQVMAFLVSQNAPAARELVLSLIPSPLPEEQPDRDYALGAAEALCSSAKPENWPVIWQSMSEDSEFGCQLVSRMASISQPDRHSLEALTDKQLADLYIWVSREFPHREDPDIYGAHTIGKREEIANWRDQYLLRLIKVRGTISACQEIKRIIKELPHVSWLHFAWLDAIRIMRSQTWQPLSPDSLLRLAKTTEARTVSCGEDLLDVVKESLASLQEALLGSTPMVQFLWDYQRSKRTWCPKEEDALSEFVAAHFKRDIGDRGVVVNREVQIRPLRGKDRGQKVDILVEAVIRLPSGEVFDVVQVIVETKGCWNRELNSSMKGQLVDRYLKENQCRHGLYLIGYFLCASWDDSDYRKKQCPKEGLEELERRFDAQAKALSVDGVCITSRILDLRI